MIPSRRLVLTGGDAGDSADAGRHQSFGGRCCIAPESGSGGGGLCRFADQPQILIDVAIVGRSRKSSASVPPIRRLTGRRNRTLMRLMTLHDDPGPTCAKSIDCRSPSKSAREKKRRSIHYSVKPSRRGASEMPAVHLRFPTRLGLWTRHQVRPLKTPDSHLSGHSSCLSL
jgi:hypothetical protein